MAKTLTASDRTALIRLASSLPAGSHERRAILAGLSKSAFGGTKMAGRDPHEEARAMIDDWKKGLRPLFSSKNFEWTDKYLAPQEHLDTYSCGKCIWLALALHDRYGFQLVADLEEGDPENPYMAHAFVRLPNGLEIDIYGVQRKVDPFGTRKVEMSRRQFIQYLADTNAKGHSASEIESEYRSEKREADRIIDRHIEPDLRDRGLLPSARRVASRYVEAGLLKAPPAMVKEITEWVQTNVGRWLDSGNFFLPANQSKVFPVDLKGWPYLRSFSKSLGKEIAETERRLKLEERFHRKRVDAAKVISRMDQTLIQEGGGEAVQTVMEAHPDLDESTVWKLVYFYDPEFDVPEPAIVVPDFLRTLFDIPQKEGGKITKRTTPEIRTLLKKVGSMPPLKIAETVLSERRSPFRGRLNEITVEIMWKYKESVRAAGRWSPTKHKLEVFPMNMSSPQNRREVFKEIAVTVEHELQHMTQDLIQILGGLSEAGGLPSRNIRRTRTPDESGSQMLSGGEKYYLSEREFYTWLTTSVRNFLNDMAYLETDRATPREWDRHRKVYIDLSVFFKTLKKHEPAKWRKAVGEFWKATEQPRSSRVASRYVEAKYDKYAPKDAREVLSTHLSIRPGNLDPELDVDVRGQYTPWAPILRRALRWSLPEFIEYMERYAFNENIEELERELAEEPLIYRVVQNGKTRVQGNTSEESHRSGNLRERIEDYHRYDRWMQNGVPWEIVVKPRPKSDYRKLDALKKMRVEREKAWADLYKGLRSPDGVAIVDDHTGSGALNFFAQDHDVFVGGILAETGGTSTDKGRGILISDDCWRDIRALAERYGDGSVWTVVRSTLWPEYRRKGVGTKLYDAVIDALKSKSGGPHFLVPHGCWGPMGSTSPDAQRVWKKLWSRYPSEGNVIVVR